MIKYKIVVSQKTLDMLKEHIAFIADVDKKAARNTKNKLLDAFKSLEEMQQRYPFFDEQYIPSNKYHKMYVEKWYLVLYQIKDETVYIDFVLDCRKDYNWLLNNS